MSTRLLTVPDVAELLSCSRQHIYRLIASGDLAAVDVHAHGSRPKTRIRESDLDAFITARTAS